MKVNKILTAGSLGIQPAPRLVVSRRLLRNLLNHRRLPPQSLTTGGFVLGSPSTAAASCGT
jgi:hypothetical protein